MINNVLWLGFAIPDKIANDLFVIDPLPAIQTHKFGWSFVHTLNIAFGGVFLASTCPVQNFPIVPRLFFRGGIFQYSGFNGIFIGFINLLGLKHLTRFFSCLFRVSYFLWKKNINLIFIHGVHSPYLLFGLLARFAGMRVIVVMTDPPSVIVPSDGIFARFLKAFDFQIIRKMLNYVDAVVALSPELVFRFSPTRPALVFPGILEPSLYFNNFNNNKKLRDEENNTFVIVYAGGLSSAYGVDRLVDAVLLLQKNKLVQLKLFGRGDQVDRIKMIASTNERIVYGGFLGFDSLLPELSQADLLINPRPTHELFASHSFPSKLIEYMAIGRPVLTTRISSIPHELSKHFYFIDDESAYGICAAIEKIMALPLVEIEASCQLAVKYVNDNFSISATAKKVLNFINNLDCLVQKE